MMVHSGEVPGTQRIANLDGEEGWSPWQKWGGLGETNEFVIRAERENDQFDFRYIGSNVDIGKWGLNIQLLEPPETNLESQA